MALTTYAELKTSIASWLNRRDLTAIIPDFISLAEGDFNRKLRTRQNFQRSYTTLAERFTLLPTDFLEMKNLQLNTEFTDPMAFRSQAQLDANRRSTYISPGKPVEYTISGDSIEASPTPDTTYEIEMAYYKRVPALSVTNTTNWVLERHPDLYLYGALLHSAPYVKEDDRVALWSNAYSEVLSRIQMEELHSSFSGGTPTMSFQPIG